MYSIRKTLALVLALLLFLPALGALAQEAPGFPKLTQRKGLHEYAEYALAPLEKTPWNTTMADVFALWGEENMGEHHREDGASKIINLKKPIKLWKGIDCVPTFLFVEDKLTVIKDAAKDGK